MENKIELALANHKKGYNCCQAVACAFAKETGIDEETLFRLSEGFGFGMGCAQGTCGAVSGAVLLAGLTNSSADLDHPNSKGSTYKLSKEIMKRFTDMNCSTVCKDLKGMDNGNMLRSCDGCIEDATRLVEDILFSDGFFPLRCQA